MQAPDPPEASASAEPEHASLPLLVALGEQCRQEVRARRQLLGWWLPAAAAVGAVTLWLGLGLGWPFAAVTLGTLFVFHRYHRHKLQRAFSCAPRYRIGIIGQPQTIMRGYRESHGLMYPVEITITHEAQLGERPELQAVDERDLCWIDGGIVERLREGDCIGVVQVPGEGVVVVDRRGEIIVSAALSLPPSLAQQVTRVRARIGDG